MELTLADRMIAVLFAFGLSAFMIGGVTWVVIYIFKHWDSF